MLRRAAADAAMQISWEVRNRFRLFREERDFLLHSEAPRRQHPGLGRGLAQQSDGRGWARNTVPGYASTSPAGSASRARETASRKAT